MRTLKPGHLYALSHLDGKGETLLQFVQRSPLHEPKEGVVCREVLRVLIDRVEHLDSELNWEGNAALLKHLRSALVLFECRAMLRKVEKDEIKPELVKTAQDGHFELCQR